MTFLMTPEFVIVLSLDRVLSDLASVVGQDLNSASTSLCPAIFSPFNSLEFLMEAPLYISDLEAFKSLLIDVDMLGGAVVVNSALVSDDCLKLRVLWLCRVSKTTLRSLDCISCSNTELQHTDSLVFVGDTIENVDNSVAEVKIFVKRRRSIRANVPYFVGCNSVHVVESLADAVQVIRNKVLPLRKV